MRLVVVGGGGFRVPLVYGALLADPDRLVDEVVLHDTDPLRARTVARVLAALAGDRPDAPRVRVEADRRTALRGADVVFAAVRPGGVTGRVHDERVPLHHGLIGQETVGLGGIFFALRSVPVMHALARDLADVAPDAWLISFTNPAGLVTEALRPVLGNRVFGICDSPAALARRVRRACGLGPDAEVDYVGLNHLGWLRAAYDEHGADRLPALLADDTALRGFEEGALFGPDLLRALRAVPNEYLHYYYFAADVLAELQAGPTRAEYLAQQQGGFYAEAADAADPLEVWTRVLGERNRTYMAGSRAAAGLGERPEEDVEGGGYERIALLAMRALLTDRPSTLILGVPNGSTYAALDAAAVVEVPCLVDARGAHPLPARGPLTDHQAGLMRTVKAVERATVTAALADDPAARTEALHAAVALHPLSGSWPRARAALEERLALG